MDDPDFSWWVKDSLRRQVMNISKIKSKYWNKSHKFCIRVPKTVKVAYEIDRKSGTEFWTKEITKEKANVCIEFDKIDNITPYEMIKQKIRPGYKRVNVNMIFNIKMNGKFIKKSRLVADGHTTSPQPSITYSSVVSRDSVRIVFIIPSLN